MKRPYLRVIPSSESVIPGDVPETLSSLHKLTRSDPESLRDRLNPIGSQSSPRFEFVAFSQGEDEPVEFYYGADDHLDALGQRLRALYPSPYDIDRVEIDITKRLIRPVEYTRTEFAERLENGRLYQQPALSNDEQATVSDGGKVTDSSASTDVEVEFPKDTSSGADHPDDDFDGIDLGAPQSLDDDEPLTALDRPTATGEGSVYARPALSEVEPYGVVWWGAAERRKDWMTTLTGFTQFLDQDSRDNDGGGQSKLPLTPLVKQLGEANRPIAFQVVFQRRPDWSRDARRRTGELLDGSDTLLQKLLGLESQGSRRRGGTRGSSHQPTERTSRSSTPRGSQSPAGGGPARPSSVEEASRYDLIRSNTPKRTFTVNLRLLTLVLEEDPDGLATTLDPLRSVFDLVDGPFYEMDGRRLRSYGYFPGSGERHARKVLEHFDSRSISTGGRRFSITNRRETRPDFVLNGDELANFFVIPPSTDLPRTSKESVAEAEAARTPVDPPALEVDETERESVEADRTERETGDGPFSSVPDSVVHRNEGISQLSAILEPLKHGEQHDPVLITGPPGSGKTDTAKYTVDQFCQENLGIDAVYVNCWEDHSPFQTLYRILDELEGATDVHRQSTPTDVILERLRDYDDSHCVLILDEVDQLDDESLLYDLLNLPRFSLLLIANREEDLLDGLDERLASRLGSYERIHLDPYSVNELVDILGERVAAGLVSRDIDRSELERIADAVDGDARVAITTLRIAARRADEAATDRITPDIVKQALPKARQELRQKHVDRLTSHQQAVYRVIEEHGRIAPQDLFEEYRRNVEDPKSNRTVRTYLKKLEQYGLIVAEGSTRDRIYRYPESRPSGSSGSSPDSE